MAKPKTYRLGDLQLQIMQVLWERELARVSDVHDALGADRFAYTTIATMLRKMEDRGLVKHKTEGRKFLYRSAIGPQTVTRRLTTDLLDRVFAGSLADMMSHLLTSRDISEDELRRLENLISERKKQS